MRSSKVAVCGLIAVLTAGCSSGGTTSSAGTSPTTSAATTTPAQSPQVGSVPGSDQTEGSESEVQVESTEGSASESAMPSVTAETVPWPTTSGEFSEPAGDPEPDVAETTGTSGSGAGNAEGDRGSSGADATATGAAGPDVAETPPGAGCPLLSLAELSEATGMRPGPLLQKSDADRARIAARGGGDECGHTFLGLPGVLVFGVGKPLGGPRVELDKLRADASGNQAQDYELGDGGVGKLTTVGSTTMYTIMFSKGEQLFTSIASTSDGAASEDLRNAAESVAEALAAK